MLVRRRTWRAPCCIGRPRVAMRASSFDRDTAVQHSQVTACLECSSTGSSSFSPPSTVSSAVRSLVGSSAENSHVNPALPPLQRCLLHHNAKSHARVWSLRDALGLRDARQVFSAVLCQEAIRSGTAASNSLFCGAAWRNEMDDLMRNPEDNAELLALAACACVAVSSPPAAWPPWVASRFSSDGSLSANSKNSAQGIGSRIPTKGHCNSSSTPDVARSLLCNLANALPHWDACGASPRLRLLKCITLLCGACCAPSEAAAVQLAREASRLSIDAAGCALFVFARCYKGLRQDTEEGADAEWEPRWLSLWHRVITPTRGAPLAPLPPLQLTGLSTILLQSGMDSFVLRQHRVSYHLHCLLIRGDVKAATQLASLLCQDRSVPVRSTSSPFDEVVPIAETMRGELLSSLPLSLLIETGLRDTLASCMLASLRQLVSTSGKSNLEWSVRVSAPTPRRRAYVPSVSTNAVLYARMLHYILSSTATARREGAFRQCIHDIALLLSVGNCYALASSCVPHHEPLTKVMVAAKDTYRVKQVKELVTSVKDTLAFLCEEAVPAVSLANTAVYDSNASEGLQFQNGYERRSESMALLSLQSYLGRESWRWREDSAAEMSNAVQVGARFLSSLLSLCSNRKSSLPLRRAEPKWRRQLREETALRTHKYELLLQELPHTELQGILRTLLCSGYTKASSELGVSLVKGDQMDLRFYNLPLLGSLYQAVLTCSHDGVPVKRDVVEKQGNCTVAADDAATSEDNDDTRKELIYRMYRRRLEVFGNADTLGPTKFSAATGLACLPGDRNTLVQAVVFAAGSQHRHKDSSATYFTDYLPNCSSTVTEGSATADVGLSTAPFLFGGWTWKGVVTSQ